MRSLLWIYALTKIAPADAYSAFEKLSQQGIESINNEQWRKVIGMRNALVHASQIIGSIKKAC